MALVSLAEYGRQHGASKQAAAKWKAKGALVIREDKVDVERSDQRMQHAALGRFKEGGAPTTAAGQPSTPKGQPPPAETTAPGKVDLADPATVQSLNAFVQQLLTGNYADATTAATVKENALALKHVLAARREAGELIDMETAERTLFEAARSTREAWMNFPTRAGPLMAAELGIDGDRLVEVLSIHVHQLLDDLGEPEQGFARSGSPRAGVPAGNDATAADQHTGVG